MSLSSSDTADELSDRAVEWVVLIHSGKATREDLADLARWRGLSLRHEDAYQEAQSLWLDMGDACAPGDTLQAVARPTTRPGGGVRRTRPRRRWPQAVAAAVLLGALGFGLDLGRFADPLLHDHHTRPGEQKPVALADGSRLLLDTDTALDVDFTATARRVHLRRGQALFRVAAGALPFEVEAGGSVARALGTVFAVRREGKAVEVVVQEHAVAVRSEDGAFADEIRVEAGEKLKSGDVRAEPANVQELLAWQRHKLIFDGQPLAQVIHELNRYRAGQIFLPDASLRQLKVTGVFPLDDADGALSAILSTLKLRETRLGLWSVLHR